MEASEESNDRMASLKAKLDADLQRRIARALRQGTEAPLGRWLRRRRR